MLRFLLLVVGPAITVCCLLLLIETVRKGSSAGLSVYAPLAAVLTLAGLSSLGSYIHDLGGSSLYFWINFAGMLLAGAVGIVECRYWPKPLTYDDEARLIYKLSVAKRRFLQAEHLCLLDKCVVNSDWRVRYLVSGELDSVVKLERAIDQLILGFEVVIPRKALKQLDRADPSVYTAREYGNKSWDEIELPWGVSDLYAALEQLHRRCPWSGDRYYVEVYDLSNQSLGFRSKTAAMAFLRGTHVAPAVLLRAYEDRVETVCSV